MAANRTPQSTNKSVSIPQGGAAGKANGKGKALPATGGEKGSNRSNDGAGTAEKRGDGDRRGKKDRRTTADRRARAERRTDAEKKNRENEKKIATKTSEKDTRERTTEAAVETDKKIGNQTKNHSQVAAVPEPGSDKKLRKTSKREPGSRKPGTEQTKKERGGQKS